MKKNRISILGAENNSFIGYYLRGRDFVNLNFTLTDSDTGEPIANVELKVYLNTSNQAIYIGSNTTDSLGQFLYKIRVLSSYPDGNVLITVVFEGDAENGLPPFRIIQSATFISVIYMTIVLDKSSKPLFEKNVTVRAWLYFDNGSIIRQRDLNFTVEVENLNTSDLFIFSMLSDETGIASFVFDYSSSGAGVYNVTVFFNASSNSFVFPYSILTTQKLYRNGTIVGDAIISASKQVKIILASKIELWFSRDGNMYKSINALRNETIIIVGLYMDVDGYPAGGIPITVAVFKDNLNILSEVRVTNSTGYFTISVSLHDLANNGGLGLYAINATENVSPSVITDKLNLLVTSSVRINIVQTPPRMVNINDRIDISGFVSDAITNEPLGGSKVTVTINYGTESVELYNTTTQPNGYFNITNMALPEFINSPNITLTISAKGPNIYLYIPDQKSFQVRVYKFVLLTLKANDTVGSWMFGNNYVNTIQSPSFSVQKGDKLIFVLNTTDEFGRPLSLNFTVEINNKIYITGQTNSTGLASFNITINDTLTINIFIDDIGEVAINLDLPNEEQPLLTLIDPILAVWITPFVILGFIGYKYKEKIFVYLPILSGIDTEKESLEQVIEDIEILLKNKIYVEASEKILKLLKMMAERLSINIKRSDTPREILKKMFPKIEKDIYRVLEQLVNIYEIVRYGEKIPDNTTVDLTISGLRKLEMFSETVYELEV